MRSRKLVVIPLCWVNCGNWLQLVCPYKKCVTFCYPEAEQPQKFIGLWLCQCGNHLPFWLITGNQLPFDNVKAEIISAHGQSTQLFSELFMVKSMNTLTVGACWLARELALRWLAKSWEWLTGPEVGKMTTFYLRPIPLPTSQCRAFNLFASVDAHGTGRVK